MVTDDETRPIRRDFDRDRDRPDIDDDPDPVESAILEEMKLVKVAQRETSLMVNRRQFDEQLDALQRKLDQHRWRRNRDDVVPGDPYHRTIEEIQAESSRLGAHH